MFLQIDISDFAETINHGLYKAAPKGKIPVTDLIPSTLAKKVTEAGFKVNWTPLPFWHKWEIGSLEVSSEKLASFFIPKELPTGQKILILSDHCFTSGKVYQTSIAMLPQLENVVIDGKRDITIWQPLDHIFWLPESSLLVLVHHDGLIAHVQLSNN